MVGNIESAGLPTVSGPPKNQLYKSDGKKTDLIWELHAELLCHLVSVEWVRCRVLLVEKVNLDKTSKWIADIFTTCPSLASPQAQWMRGSASQERIGKEKRQYPNNIRILKH